MGAESIERASKTHTWEHSYGARWNSVRHNLN